MRARLVTLAAALRRVGRLSLREATLTSAAFVTGLGMTAVGVGLVHLPAGLITGGVELAAAAVLYARGSGA